MPIPIPEDEPARLMALHRYEILDTAPAPDFESLTRVAADLCGVPIAGMSLVDRDRQWFKSCTDPGLKQTPRDISFCAHTILNPDGVLLIEDAATDPRFAANPLVTDGPRIRFYAGIPLCTPEGHPIGALCIIDHKVRRISSETLARLTSLRTGFLSLLRLHRMLVEQRSPPLSDPTARLLETRLRQAVARNEITVFWQRRVNAATGRITGYEALARWHCKEAGWISPGEFIPVAEASGLVTRIDHTVLREACRAASGWPAELSIAVNASAAWFVHGDLPGVVAQVLAETGLNPERLEIELTESVLVADMERALDIVTRLRSLGVRLALDDFGKGYSSLSYLEVFPFDKLKLDQSFVQSLVGNSRSQAVARAVMQLACALGMTVCAEGVELMDQLNFLRAEGCDEVQGYLLGRPQPFADFEAVPEAPAERCSAC